MTIFRRLVEAIGLGDRPSPDQREAINQLEQLKAAATLAAEYRSQRSERTGNPVAEMARGVYEPARKRDRDA